MAWLRPSRLARRGPWLGGAFAALLCGASSAAASDRVEAAPSDEPALVTAKRLHADLRYAEALRALDRALEQPNPLAQVIEIYELRGLIAAALDRPAEAKRDFARLLMIDPDHTLPDYVAPRFRSLFEEAQVESGGASIRAFVEAPSSVRAGEPVPLEVRLESDPLGMVDRVRITQRVAGTVETRTTEVRAATLARLTLTHVPAPSSSGVLEFWCALLDARGNELGRVHSEAAPGRVAWQPAAAGAAAVAGGAATSLAVEPEAPLWQRWWFWTAIGGGAVAVAAITTAAVLAAPSFAPLPGARAVRPASLRWLAAALGLAGCSADGLLVLSLSVGATQVDVRVFDDGCDGAPFAAGDVADFTTTFPEAGLLSVGADLGLQVSPSWQGRVVRLEARRPGRRRRAAAALVRLPRVAGGESPTGAGGDPGGGAAGALPDHPRGGRRQPAARHPQLHGVAAPGSPRRQRGAALLRHRLRLRCCAYLYVGRRRGGLWCVGSRILQFTGDAAGSAALVVPAGLTANRDCPITCVAEEASGARVERTERLQLVANSPPAGAVWTAAGEAEVLETFSVVAVCGATDPEGEAVSFSWPAPLGWSGTDTAVASCAEPGSGTVYEHCAGRTLTAPAVSADTTETIVCAADDASPLVAAAMLQTQLQVRASTPPELSFAALPCAADPCEVIEGDSVELVCTALGDADADLGDAVAAVELTLPVELGVAPPAGTSEVRHSITAPPLTLPRQLSVVCRAEDLTGTAGSVPLTLSILQNQAPEPSLNLDAATWSVFANSQHQLSCAVSDANGDAAFDFAWECQAPAGGACTPGVLTATGATATFVAPLPAAPATYDITCRATDRHGLASETGSVSRGLEVLPTQDFRQAALLFAGQRLADLSDDLRFLFLGDPDACLIDSLSPWDDSVERVLGAAATPAQVAVGSIGDLGRSVAAAWGAAGAEAFVLDQLGGAPTTAALILNGLDDVAGATAGVVTVVATAAGHTVISAGPVAGAPLLRAWQVASPPLTPAALDAVELTVPGVTGRAAWIRAAAAPDGSGIAVLALAAVSGDWLPTVALWDEATPGWTELPALPSTAALPAGAELTWSADVVIAADGTVVVAWPDGSEVQAARWSGSGWLSSARALAGGEQVRNLELEAAPDGSVALLLRASTALPAGAPLRAALLDAAGLGPLQELSLSGQHPDDPTWSTGARPVALSYVGHLVPATPWLVHWQAGNGNAFVALTDLAGDTSVAPSATLPASDHYVIEPLVLPDRVSLLVSYVAGGVLRAQFHEYAVGLAGAPAAAWPKVCSGTTFPLEFPAAVAGDVPFGLGGH